MNSSRIYEIEVDAAFSLFFLEFLYPHQTVAISMTATTGGGEGPASAWVSNTTAQSGLLVNINKYSYSWYGK